MSPKWNTAYHLLWPLIRSHKGRIVVAGLAIVVAALSVLAFGWTLQNLVDQGFATRSAAPLNQALILLLGVVFLTALAAYGRFQSVHRVAESVGLTLRQQLFQKLLSLDPSYYAEKGSGSAVSTLIADVTLVQTLVATHLPIAVRHLLTLIGGLIMLLTVNARLTGLILLVVPAVILPLLFFGRRVRKRSRATQDRFSDLNSFSQETLQNLQTIQSFTYENKAAHYFQTLAQDIFFRAQQYIRLRAFLTAYAISSVFLGIVVVLWVGGHQVLREEISAGILSAFIFYAIVVSGAVTSLSEALSALNQGTGAAERVQEALSAKTCLTSMTPFSQNFQGAITFKNVSFAYPQRHEQQALADVSFSLQAGERVTLVGPSGAGKTTIFQILQRFYDPQFGQVLLDDQDISTRDPSEIRKNIMTVAQNPALFSFSVAENIRVGRPEATDTEVKNAACLAQADEFIQALPQGYQTPLGENGNQLSGGQRQRIAIARAILKNAKVLLLDEATSALDTPNEEAVHAALKNLMQGRTTLIISHRMSTIRDADRIIVLDQGHIVAKGTHQELYNRNPLYTLLTQHSHQ